MKHQYTNIHSINTLLQNSPIILNIQNKLQQLQQLYNSVANLLPPWIARNCTVANLNNGILILTTTSPAWNHQLNFLKIDLLEKLRASNPLWAGISSIVVKTDYTTEELNAYQCNSKPNNPKKILNVTTNNTKHFYISTKTAKIIKCIANNDISYPPLSKALKSLAEKLESEQ